MNNAERLLTLLRKKVAAKTEKRHDMYNREDGATAQ